MQDLAQTWGSEQAVELYELLVGATSLVLYNYVTGATS